MASGAQGVRAVIARICGARVVEAAIEESRGRVTTIAGKGRREVAVRLSDGRDAIVAILTGSRSNGRVIKKRRQERIRIVAGLAVVACWQMRRMFAGGRRSVVTAEAARRDACMIEGDHRNESRGRVAQFAAVVRWQVGGMFAGCSGPVVASETPIDDARVIEGRG